MICTTLASATLIFVLFPDNHQMHQDDCLLIQFSHQKILVSFSWGQQLPFFVDLAACNLSTTSHIWIIYV